MRLTIASTLARTKATSHRDGSNGTLGGLAAALMLGLVLLLTAGCGGGDGDGGSANGDRGAAAGAGGVETEAAAGGAGGAETEAAAGGAGGAETEAAAGGAGGVETVQLAIGGMYCQGCADGIQAALAKAPGVRSCSLSFADSVAVVSLEPGSLTAEELIGIVEDVGYKAQVKP